MCPDALNLPFIFVGRYCWYWGKRSANPEDYLEGCSLTEGCGPVCTRDPEFNGSGTLSTGHVAGFDLFNPDWCSDAEHQLPTRETREFWFPPTWDRPAWRRARYERRVRARAVRRRKGR